MFSVDDREEREAEGMKLTLSDIDVLEAIKMTLSLRS